MPQKRLIDNCNRPISIDMPCWRCLDCPGRDLSVSLWFRSSSHSSALSSLYVLFTVWRETNLAGTTAKYACARNHLVKRLLNTVLSTGESPLKHNSNLLFILSFVKESYIINLHKWFLSFGVVIITIVNKCMQQSGNRSIFYRTNVRFIWHTDFATET